MGCFAASLTRAQCLRTCPSASRRPAIDDAIAAPRWTFDRSVLLFEEGLPPLEPLPAGLTACPMPIADLAGHAHAILVEEQGLVAACDPRADGVAVGE